MNVFRHNEDHQDGKSRTSRNNVTIGNNHFDGTATNFLGNLLNFAGHSNNILGNVIHYHSPDLFGGLRALTVDTVNDAAIRYRQSRKSNQVSENNNNWITG